MSDVEILSDSPSLGDRPPAIDLSGLTILCLDESREPLAGPHTADDVAELFISHWIPHLECQECGRSDYCKFTKPHPYPAPRSVGRLAEIRCGVAATMINNYVEGVFPLLIDLSTEELQKFLDGSYHLVRFVYEAEQDIGSMINKYYMDWLGKEEHRAHFFGMTAQLRRHLDSFAGQLQELEVFRTKATVILTEGASEKAFLEKLGQSGLVWFRDLDIQSYYGRGNRGTKNLTLLATRLRQQGYELFIQGDCDGRVRDIFQQLVRRGIVDTDNTFAFEVDFESAFLPAMLYNALSYMGMLEGTDFDDFNDRMSKRPAGQSVLHVLTTQLQLQVDKVELADALGTEFNAHFGAWNPDSILWSSEIGRFLDKIRRLP